MEVVYERCCGIDVHKNMLMVCIFTSVRKKEIREFGTMTEDIQQLAAWIKETNCQVAAMESTGIYWKPVYNILEGEGIELIVVNAQHIKAVPGRKTDVKDAEWIADLVRHGLVKASFVPNREQRELREMVRYRNEIVNERARELNRIQAVLEGANIKLSSVVTDISCKSSMEILHAIIDGKEYKGITNYGARPTFENDSVITETYFYGYSGDLYGKKLKISFVKRLRDIQKFESVEALKKQLEEDIRRVIEND